MWTINNTLAHLQVKSFCLIVSASTDFMRKLIRTARFPQNRLPILKKSIKTYTKLMSFALIFNFKTY